MTDDQRGDTLGCYGNSIVRTPNIDELARRSVVFDPMFVTTSICAPSRASIFTGQYVSRHGVWNFRTELTPQQHARSYPGRLKQAGYRIGFIGKWGVGSPPHVQDSYDLRDNPFPLDPALEHLYAEVTIPLPKTGAGTSYDQLPRFLKDSENRMRWAVRFWGPGRYQESVKSYYRLISGVDRVVGRVVGKLEEKGFAGNTIILYTADNGFYLGEYGLAGKWLPHEVSIACRSSSMTQALQRWCASIGRPVLASTPLQ